MILKDMIAMVKTATEKGAEKALFNARSRDNFSKSEAYKIYGRQNVDRWLAEGLIKISNKKINRLELEAIAAESNRVTYLPVAER